MDGPTTGGQRIYAIGDVHGRRDLLDAIIGRIEADLRQRPHPRARIVFLGDYVDRGPDSRGVIERLLALEAGPVATTFLLGNHDAALLEYLADPEGTERGFHWFNSRMGGAATLASYGVTDAAEQAPARSHAAFLEAFPIKHHAFLMRCATIEWIGGYAFVHAGVRPGVPLDQQTPEDLLWIREPFLSSTTDMGVKVVHGHTIVRYVQHHPNRIAVDTGAVRTGTLSCVILDDEDVALLTSNGPRPLPVGAGLGIDRMRLKIADRIGRFWGRAINGRAKA